MTQQGYGVGGIFRSRNIAATGEKLKPLLGEIGKIGVTVGANLLKNMVASVIDGKTVKEAPRESGKEAGKQSINLVGKKAVDALKAPFKPKPKPVAVLQAPTAVAPFKPAGVKRPRSQSPPRKRKKQKKSQKKRRKRTQSTTGNRKKRRGVRRNGKAIGAVFPRAMTSKQRRSLPAKDIFG